MIFSLLRHETVALEANQEVMTTQVLTNGLRILARIIADRTQEELRRPHGDSRPETLLQGIEGNGVAPTEKT